MSRKSKREALTPELTPLIDVVFLLLIFFMVSSVFKKEELALLLSLPKTEEGKKESVAKDTITIELSGQKIAFNGKDTSLENLNELLEDVQKKSLVNLRVDGEVKYQRLVKVLDTLQKYKLENLSLITERENTK
ncbi:MAG: biopolymer transporter ExbD [Halobacteriovoraceae bacterium]|nr:biopolymer transporter ExbD [Halobacteriovoraceae bacterium]|tara:strand:- start:48309 stop:48710 length:402 start_codon:yes stop_codon:yes gene_type:complete